MAIYPLKGILPQCLVTTLLMGVELFALVVFCLSKEIPLQSLVIMWLHNGGAVYYISFHGNISYEEFSTVVFRNNVAEYGGALFTQTQSDIIFTDNSTVKFINNKATCTLFQIVVLT